jgi:hypothetical protein
MVVLAGFVLSETLAPYIYRLNLAVELVFDCCEFGFAPLK